jgi:proline iminopeptidase
VGGLVAGFGVAAGVAWLAGGLLGPTHRNRRALVVGAGTGVLVTVVSALTIFAPLVKRGEVAAVEVSPDTRFWDLPTGSRIAFRRIPGSSPDERSPVVFLHGGPGAGVVSTPEVAEAFSFVASLGRDVYLYDQVGGGRSGRLVDRKAYTIGRHVEDLEAIRQTLGAETFVLIGESWGGELACHYIARHPERVERCVLVSPGPLHPADWGDTDPCDLKSRASPGKRQRFDEMVRQAAPRLLAARLLLEVNPEAVGELLPDAEADAFARRLLSPLLGGMVCDSARLPADAHFDFGLWGNAMTDEDIESQEARIDEKLGAFERPVLILRGECDYCLPEVSRQYETLLPNAGHRSIDGAGHIIWLDRPDDFARLVGSFLAEEADAPDLMGE